MKDKQKESRNENRRENRSSGYDDMIYQKRPVPCRPMMPVLNRAKQFAPFAALKGYEEAVSDMTWQNQNAEDSVSRIPWIYDKIWEE